MKRRWTESEKELFIKSMKSPFRNIPKVSNRSRASSEREYNINSFMNRITPQIIETYNRGLLFETPEQWDYAFKLLGGGQSRRKSNKILARMNWETFLKLSKEIIESKD